MNAAIGFFFAVLFANVSLANPADATAVLRADERRIHAIMSRDATQLRELLSESLHYAHADGRVQTKAQLLASLSTLALNHVSVDPAGVKFQPIADGAAMVTGQTRIVVETRGQQVAFTLQFLSVWRQEGGVWRLIAYQSAQLSPTTAAAPK